MMKNQHFLIVLMMSLFFLGCQPSGENQEEVPNNAHLGEISFEVKGDPEAVSYFEEGVLRLHSFEYADARASFEKALAIDSSLTMAYWGIAMTHNHPLWRNQKTDAAQAILSNLGADTDSRYAKAGNDFERDLLKGAELLFFGDEDKFERDQAYANWMKQLYEKYPGNHEIAAFYALSILGAVPVGKDQEAYDQSAGIAQSILEENPNHPGALHYLIHAYDNPNRAIQAKMAADKYAKVAPDAAHALHMPSHIYVSLGLWHEVVASNVASYEASVKRMKRMGLDNDGRSYHAYAWLLYGYLQQEQFELGETLIRDMVKYTEEKPSKGARGYLVDMQANYLLHTNAWESEWADMPIEVDDLNITTRAAYAFTKGMKAYRMGNADELGALVQDLRAEIEASKLLVTESGVPVCNKAGSYGSLPNQTDIDQAIVMQLELESLLADLQEKPDLALEKLEAAVALENSTPFGFGPPNIVYPSHELLGNWLTDNGNPTDAIQYFKEALARGPKRILAVKGLEKAATLAYDRELAAEMDSVLQEINDLIRPEDVLAIR